MTIVLAIACLAFAASTIYFWRKYMTVNDLLAKVTAANAAADSVPAKLAAKDAEIADLQSKIADPAVVQQVSDGLDQVIAKLS